MSLLKKFVTDPLFHFKENILNPLVANVAAKIDAAVKAEGISNRIEQLLAAREEAESNLSAAAKGADKNSLPAVVAFAIGLFLMPAVLFAAPAAGALSLPLAALFCTSIGLATAGMGGVLKGVINAGQANADKAVLEDKIDGEIRAMTQSSPAEAIKSPRFVKAMADNFNGSAARAGSSLPSYDALVKRAASKPRHPASLIAS